MLDIFVFINFWASFSAIPIHQLYRLYYIIYQIIVSILIKLPRPYTFENGNPGTKFLESYPNPT